MSNTILITGISGFVGSWLTEELLRRNYIVAGLVMPNEQLPDLPVYGNISTHIGDLLDPPSLAACIESTQPDAIVHLAAESAPSKSYAMPRRFFDVNVIGTQNLFEAARRQGFKGKLAVFTSSEIYGIVPPEAMPLREDYRLSPMNPYAASKAACHHLMRQYALNFGLQTVEIRPFNMLGPRQGLGFVLPDWCRQVAEILAGNREPVLRVGRLTAQRDFVDVRDAVRGMADILEKGEPGYAYHVCRGKSVTVQHLLDSLLKAAEAEISVEEDPKLLRPTRLPVLYGSNERLRSLNGWEPKITLEQTVRETLDYWRQEIAQ